MDDKTANTRSVNVQAANSPQASGEALQSHASSHDTPDVYQVLLEEAQLLNPYSPDAQDVSSPKQPTLNSEYLQKELAHAKDTGSTLAAKCASLSASNDSLRLQVEHERNRSDSAERKVAVMMELTKKIEKQANRQRKEIDAEKAKRQPSNDNQMNLLQDENATLQQRISQLDLQVKQLRSQQFAEFMASGPITANAMAEKCADHITDLRATSDLFQRDYNTLKSEFDIRIDRERAAVKEDSQKQIDFERSACNEKLARMEQRCNIETKHRADMREEIGNFKDYHMQQIRKMQYIHAQSVRERDALSSDLERAKSALTCFQGEYQRIKALYFESIEIIESEACKEVRRVKRLSTSQAPNRPRSQRNQMRTASKNDYPNNSQDPLLQSTELLVKALILAAETSSTCGDFNKALYRASQARAHLEDSIACLYVGRCAYWQGRAAFGLEDYAKAKSYFMEANAHRRSFVEGKEVTTWLQKCAAMLSKQTAEDTSLTSSEDIQQCDAGVETVSPSASTSSSQSDHEGSLLSPGSCDSDDTASTTQEIHVAADRPPSQGRRSRLLTMQDLRSRLRTLTPVPSESRQLRLRQSVEDMTEAFKRDAKKPSLLQRRIVH